MKQNLLFVLQKGGMKKEGVEERMPVRRLQESEAVKKLAKEQKENKKRQWEEIEMLQTSFVQVCFRILIY